MDLFRVICFLGGALALAAALKNWDWFFAHPKARWMVAVLGRGGARAFYGVLGTLLILVAVITTLRDARNMALEGQGPIVSITATYPGANAATVASHVAAPLDHQLLEAHGTRWVVSESRRDGSYTARVQYAYHIEPREAVVIAQNRVVLARTMLPPTVELSIDSVHAEPIDERANNAVVIAVVDRGEEPNWQQLHDYAAAVARQLAGDQAMLAAKVVDPPPAANASEATLIVRVNNFPAVRIQGVAPAGKDPYMTGLKCTGLAKEVRHTDELPEPLDAVNLTTRTTRGASSAAIDVQKMN
jgi:hypothetical protein